MRGLRDGDGTEGFGETNPGGGEAKQQAALSQLGGATETMFDDFDHADLVSLAKRYGIKRDGVQPLR